MFSVEGLINEYVEPARILRKGKLTTIDPLTEPEDFHIARFSPLVAFHTSGGTSMLPETFEGRVGESFEKDAALSGTLRSAVRTEGAGTVLWREDEIRESMRSRGRP